MRVFVDTSAFLAVLDQSEPNHAAAGALWRTVVEEGWPLVTSNYIAVESMAVIQNRLGLEAARTLAEDLLPLTVVHWVDRTEHDAAVAAVLTARRRQLSLVDCTSFLIARALGIDTVFTLDRHFAQQGFKCIPAPASTPS